MSEPEPPRWLECLLILLLRSRDREAISGDLLKEYREERLPLLYLTARRGPALRRLLLAGATVIVWIGVSALRRDLHTPHFEGFVALIALVLILQGAFTFLLPDAAQAAGNAQ
jgi:hypothetical protein